ncbi:MAG: hypothetical protein QOK11_2528 [Pseudonocardiales bacterium]|nr:hypothetical protein [Pseudonocardiales bacterium]
MIGFRAGRVFAVVSHRAARTCHVVGCVGTAAGRATDAVNGA